MKLKDYRMSNNLTQGELAEKLNVKRTTISMWENNNSQPNIIMLKKLATILNCSVDDLIKEET